MNTLYFSMCGCIMELSWIYVIEIVLPAATYNKLLYTINISIPMRPYNDEAKFNLTLLFLSQLLLRPNFQEECTESTRRLGKVKPLHNMTHNPTNAAYLQCKMEKYCFFQKMTKKSFKSAALIMECPKLLTV